jgi:hypothetical protein
VLRGAADGKDALRNLVDLYKRIGVELFKLYVELEEFLTGNIPMQPTGICVEQLVVSKSFSLPDRFSN